MRRTIVLVTVAFLACGTTGDDEPPVDTPVATDTVAEATAPGSSPQPASEAPRDREETLEEHAPIAAPSGLVLKENGTPSISGDLEGVSLDLYHIDGEWTLISARGTVDGVNVRDSAYRVTPVVVDFGDTLYVGFYVTDRATSEVVAARRTTVYRR